eukprot:GHVS01052964.1.p1 GENE.GHVS01052964.1~~GHVS01052964.1.p1  ORF type:complete len:107 (-),score=7.65 GHVS01052964.1:601-921(-)
MCTHITACAHVHVTKQPHICTHARVVHISAHVLTTTHKYKHMDKQQQVRTAMHERCSAKSTGASSSERGVQLHYKTYIRQRHKYPDDAQQMPPPHIPQKHILYRPQ